MSPHLDLLSSPSVYLDCRRQDTLEQKNSNRECGARSAVSQGAKRVVRSFRRRGQRSA